jgi:hypothetical protein
MQLVSLNIWGGKANDALVSFIEAERAATDIFCFQEVWASPRADIKESRGTHVHMLDELTALLPGFSAHFFPVQDGLDVDGKVDFELTEGQAIFVRDTLPVFSEGQVFTRGERNSSPEGWERVPTALCYVRVPFRGAELTAVSFHDIPFPGDKLDTPERLEQSRRIVEFVKKEKGELVLLGDFNLLPGTESIRMLEPHLRNLITEYHIKTTRSRISLFYGKPDEQFFADFAFVSPGINVHRFAVPEDCVASDHLPMLIEFD